jgi:hypothetical protein
MASYGQAPSTHDSGAHPAPLRHGAPTEAELRALLSQHEGNVAAVGRVLGKARMQIHRWVERYAIDLDDYRSGGKDVGKERKEGDRDRDRDRDAGKLVP